MKAGLNNWVRFFKKHLSLFVIVFGAGCLFISNIITKGLFTPKEYGEYSIVVTYFSLLYLFGILGTEQGFLRFSFCKEKGTIETYKNQIILVICVAFFSAILGAILFNYFYDDIVLNRILFFLAGIGIVFLLFLFNILRLNQDFVLSQLIANYWKIALFLISICYFVFKEINFENYINFFLINIILGFVIAVFFVASRIKFLFNTSSIKLLPTFFHFFLSILTFTLVTFSDRFLVESKFSIQEFGDYFYLSNFFLAPYSIIQNYIGFKQLVFFKDNFTVKIFKQKNKKSIIIGIVIGVSLFLLVSLISYFDLITFDFKNHTFLIVLLIVTGVVRLYSSSILSAFEAKVSVDTLKKTNIVIVFITVIMLISATYLTGNIQEVLFCVIIIWASRAFIHRYMLLKQIQNDL